MCNGAKQNKPTPSNVKSSFVKCRFCLQVVFEYTVEIFPAHLVETPVKSVKYHRVPDLENSEQGGMLVPDCRETEALMCKVHKAASHL